MAILLPQGKQQFETSAGVPLVGGKVYTYDAGTTNPRVTYQDAAGTVPNANPVILDARGEAVIFWAGAYKVTLKDPLDVTIWTVDNISTNPGATGSLIPSADNAFDLGSAAFAWRQLYLGPGDAVAYDNASGNIGYLARTAAEIASAKVPTAFSFGTRPHVDAARFGLVGDGATDDTGALNSAIASLNGRGSVWWRGTAKVTAQIVLPTGVQLIGDGYSENNGVGAGNRGATCILRAFVGALCTVLASGDDCGIDGVDFDNNLQGTGECLQVTGSRFRGGDFSCRNSGGDGFRIGKTDAGASTINANAWSCRKVIVCGNVLAGFRIDDTNTSVTLGYPLGISNANAGHCAIVDARNNGTDGLQIGNANDNVFDMVASQFNTGCGIRFKTDGTNSGPRCNKILGNDSEANTGNDIQIDAATLPVSGPGLYNLVMGNRSVAVNSRIVDNSTGSLVMQWTPGLARRAYQFGPDVSTLQLNGATGTASFAAAVMTVTAVAAGTFAVGQEVISEGVAQGTTIASLGTGTGGVGTYNLSTAPGVIAAQAVSCGGQAGWNGYAGLNASPGRWYAFPVGAADSALRAQVHKSGVGNVDCLEVNEWGVFRPFFNLAALAYTSGVAMTIDSSKGNDFELNVNDAVAYTIAAPIIPRLGQSLTLTVRNVTAGALGAATFNAIFKQSAWVNPAAGFSRSITWRWNGANWVEKSRTPADVPN